MINPKNTRGRATKGQAQDSLTRQYGGIGIAAVAAATSVKANASTASSRRDATVLRLLDSVTE